jgi:hypothetical protein
MITHEFNEKSKVLRLTIRGTIPNFPVSVNIPVNDLPQFVHELVMLVETIRNTAHFSITQ